MKRAAGYVRRSALDDGTSVSLDVQRDAIAKKAAELGYAYESARDLYDEGSGVSGAALPHERPALAALLRDLAEYDVVIVYHQDRVSRDDLVWATVVRALRDAKTDMVATSHVLNLADASGRMQAGVMSAMSSYWRDTIAEKSAEAHAERARKGYYRGGPVPFGWTLEPTDGGRRRLTPHPEEAQLVREAVDRIIAGESARAIALDFNRRGIRQVQRVGKKDGKLAERDGGLWESGHLTRNLRHPRMRGWATYKGDVVRDEAGRPMQVHEPMVSARTWRRLQDRLDAQAGRHSSGRRVTPRTNTYRLTGLVKCGECGAPMHGSGGGARLSYVCSSRSRRGTDGNCPGVSFQVEALEYLVDLEVHHRLMDVAEQEPERLHALLSPDEEDPKTAAVEAEIEAVRHAMERLQADRSAGIYDDDQDLYRVEFRRLSAERKRLVAKRDEMTAVAPSLDELRAILGDRALVPADVDLDAAAVVYDLVLTGLTPDDPLRYRATLGGLVDHIKVHKGWEHRGSSDLLARAGRVRVVYTGPLAGIVGSPAASLLRESDTHRSSPWVGVPVADDDAPASVRSPA